MKRPQASLLLCIAIMPWLTSCAVKRWTHPPGATVPVTMKAGNSGGGVLSAVNAYRSSKGKSPLQREAQLDALALQHSAYMMRHRSKHLVSHDGYQGRVREAQQKFGYRGLSENVGASSSKGAVQDIVGFWTGSRPHRSSILGQWDATGIGVVVDSDGMVFVTQVFGRR